MTRLRLTSKKRSNQIFVLDLAHIICTDGIRDRLCIVFMVFHCESLRCLSKLQLFMSKIIIQRKFNRDQFVSFVIQRRIETAQFCKSHCGFGLRSKVFY